VPLYTWVSSFVKKAGWDKLAPLGKRLEDLGGEIGTHSKFHEIDGKMTPDRWREELDGSVEEIEHNMQAAGFSDSQDSVHDQPGRHDPDGGLR